MSSSFIRRSWAHGAKRSVVMLVALAAVAGRADAADVVLGSGVGDKVRLQIKKKSGDPAKHHIKFSAKDPGLLFSPGAGTTDNPLVNGATLLLLGPADCQCVPLAASGWIASPKTGTPKKYKWKDAITRSSARLSAGKVKVKRKSGVGYGLDGTPQGSVEVQLRFGTSPDVVCTRLESPTHDDPTLFKSKTFAAGMTTCNIVPPSCAPCVPTPGSTTTTTTTTTNPPGTIPCGSAVAPTCDGTCPPGSTCGNEPCACVPFPIPCGAFNNPPACSGECPLAMPYCVDASGTCQCAASPGPAVTTTTTLPYCSFAFKWGTPGSGPGQFDGPSSIAADAIGNVFVGDSSGRIQKFTWNGGLLTGWATDIGGFPPTVQDLTIDAVGRVIAVGGNGTGTVRVYSGTGTLLSGFNASPSSGFGWVGVDSSSVLIVGPGPYPTLDVLRRYIQSGTYLGDFGPQGFDVAVDPSDNVYLIQSNEVRKYTAGGALITSWGGSGNDDGKFHSPNDMVASVNRVVVSDGTRNDVQVFTSSGTFLGKIGLPGGGSQDGYFDYPNAVAVFGNTVYVADYDNHRVQAFYCPPVP